MQLIQRIKELAKTNDINTCWSVLALCESCELQGKCDEQNPTNRLREIYKLCEEMEGKRD